jgi:hypothetical protein
MSTTVQILANRHNAQKSTGPKTDEGKVAVSQNAVKHGLFAESVIKGENEAEFEAFHSKMLAELSPVGMIESTLAERIDSLFWRLKRAERMQNEVIDDMIGREVTSNHARHEREYYYIRQGIMMGDPRMDLDDLPLGRIAVSDWSNCRALDRMLMYERRIENSVIKLMKELKRFQVMRRIELEDAEQKQPLDSEPSPPAENNGDLKKQSQFAAAMTDAKSFVKEDYDNTPASGARENKANLSQLQDSDSDSAFEFEEKSIQHKRPGLQKT